MKLINGNRECYATGIASSNRALSDGNWHYLSHAICLAAKLNIADLLKDGPRHLGELVQATGTDAAALNRVLCLLASARIPATAPRPSPLL